MALCQVEHGGDRDGIGAVERLVDVPKPAFTIFDLVVAGRPPRCRIYDFPKLFGLALVDARLVGQPARELHPVMLGRDRGGRYSSHRGPNFFEVGLKPPAKLVPDYGSE